MLSEPPPSVPDAPANDDPDRFVDRVGSALETLGMPPIAARLLSLLLLESGPISFGDLAKRLGVSRGSISMNARMLEEKRIIERLSFDGERQDFFQLTTKPLANLLNDRVGRMTRTSDALGALLAEFEDGTRERRRVCAIRNFFTDVAAKLAEIADCLKEPSKEDRTR
ncbi:GbsR/MarR family transcriptional regulator [Consotaella aegiceratis]|uniref:GbsR/MarR family transcriptional regulator n=1 Tax=Consotaella aegiceratis TaxID=3097961 RepID=UPI002F42A1C3